MIRTTSLCCTALSLLLFAAPSTYAQDERPRMDEYDDDEGFDEDEDDEEGEDLFEMDLNKNGKIERDEADLSAREFKRMDRDGDGGITPEELQAFELEEWVNEVFVEHDADLSGTLARAELPEDLREEFGEADANGDGQVSGKELLAFFEEQERSEVEGDEESGDLAAAVIRACDQAKGKTLNAETFPATPRLFAAMDADSDGTLTRVEAVEFRKQGLSHMEGVWEIEERAEELGVDLESLDVLMQEAELCFQAGRYAELPEVVRTLRQRLRRQGVARRGKRAMRERGEDR